MHIIHECALYTNNYGVYIYIYIYIKREREGERKILSQHKNCISGNNGHDCVIQQTYWSTLIDKLSNLRKITFRRKTSVWSAIFESGSFVETHPLTNWRNLIAYTSFENDEADITLQSIIAHKAGDCQIWSEITSPNLLRHSCLENWCK